MKRIVCTVAASCLLLSPFVARATGRSVTIDVHDAQLSDVIALLASESGTNIVADASVKPERVTLHLQDVRFEDALAVLVAANGLQVRRQGSVLIVGAAESMNRRYGESGSALAAQTVVLSLAHASPDDTAKEIGDALPPGTVIIADKRTGNIVVTGDADTIARARMLVAALDSSDSATGSGITEESYHLRYLKAEDVVKELKALDATGVFVADAAQNSVIVGGAANTQGSVARLLANIDVPSPQVMFEVKVADVTPQNDQSNFGLEFGGLDLNGQPLSGATTYAFKGGSVPLNVTLNALVSNGRAEILATPKVVTINNKEADLLIGETYPIVYNTSVLGGQNVQFVDIGVKLRLTPTIGTDGTITAELHPEYSELQGFTSSGYPIITNRKIDSTLRVADNETIVLGGLMRDVQTETIQKIPGLSSIPVLGGFFKNKETSHERDEIVFFITPHILTPADVKPR